MEADFTARPVRYHNSFLFTFFLLLICCSPSDKRSVEVKLDYTLQIKTWSNGMLFINSKPFSGTLFTLYPETKDTADISVYQEGLEHGIWKAFYENGSIAKQREFNRGRKTGTYLAWWENGNTKLQYSFENDEYEGVCREWNALGKLTKEMTYRKGHEDGSQKMFYDNGKVRSNYRVVNGRRFGLLGTKNCINVSDSVFKN
ncbi:toxin-antitoxin system YwqK family antitoxin [Dyadobacter psychrotolerans]|uniref:Toxin-antitoxin system YwqK family antitoxin n=1 Tax=Dyadobacter psychrotolerans TaxID=2541721 RepID=A0A4R5DGB9_9BACT|nr:toxin-antitoxin system YwqK family antitoxin [Dyadobacter psychrotolerans]TDE12849.1 toxin-antitoxin system YwqK family antitoxin [Dyadobacter psychrotolerans]